LLRRPSRQNVELVFVAENAGEYEAAEQAQTELRAGLKNAKRLVEQTRSRLSGDAPSDMA
jgi:hypothetical protein